jgi:hypothetical protein
LWQQLKNMSQQLKENNQDFTKNWVSSSRFLFYLSIAVYIIFILGSCYRLYQQRYKGKPNIEVQGSTKYTPEYK